MSLEEDQARLQSLRELEASIEHLTARQTDLEVEAIVAGVMPVEPPQHSILEGLGAKLAGRIVDALERCRDIERGLARGRSGRDSAAQTQERLAAGVATLETWLAPGAGKQPSRLRQIMPMVVLLVVIGVGAMAWTLHLAMLLLLVPVGGALSFLTGTGYDTQFEQLGAQRRFESTGLKQPREWKDAAVQNRLDSLKPELEAATLLAAELAETTEPSEEELASLAEEQTQAELTLAAALAEANLELRDLEALPASELKALGRPYQAATQLRRVKSELKSASQRANAARDHLFRQLSSAGLAPADGRTDVEALDAGLRELAQQSEES